MIAAEQVLARRRLQVLDDQVRLDALTCDLHEDEDRWISDFIRKLAGVIGNIGRGKLMHSHRKSYSPDTPSLWLEPAIPPCAGCGARMMITRISPAEPGFDLYTFECTKCGHTSRHDVEYHASKRWVPVVKDG
jgi:hypothetical protein